MSAGITFWCDFGTPEGDCGEQVSIATTDLTAARLAAERAGWQLTAKGDLCAHYHAPRRQPSERPRRIR